MPTSRHSIRTLLLLPIASLVMLAAAMSAGLGTYFGERATHALVGRVVAESTEGLRVHLGRYVDQAFMSTGVNAQALRHGVIDADDLFRQPEAWFVGQHQLFSFVDDIYFGRNDGAIVGVDKAGGNLVLKLTTDFPWRSFFPLDAQGQRGAATKTEAYDATTRDWFKRAMAAGQPVWTPVYALQNKQALGITAAQPAHDRSGRAVGVVGANLVLDSISNYLELHAIDGQTAAYIVDPKGELIATSVVGQPTTQRLNGSFRRMPAVEASSAAVAQSYRALMQAGASSDVHNDPVAPMLELDIAGAPHMVFVSPFKDPRGLDWRIVTVVDPTSYLTGVRQMAHTTWAMGAVLLVLLSALVWWSTRRMAAPIQALSQAASGIAQGGQGQLVADVGGGRELSHLVAAFNHMSLQLQQAMSRIQAHTQQLESDVAQRTADLVVANRALAEGRDQAQAASLAKTAFLANLSHEIRTPLTTIAGTCYLMRSDDLNAQQASRMDTLEAANQHVLGILNSVLDLSKIEAGRFELDEGPLWIDAVVANVMSMMEGAARAKRLALSCSVAAMPGPFLGDRIRLQQMLLNYVSNAVKFTETGSVAIQVSVAQESAEDSTLLFEVQDTGTPIPPADLARLFQPFQQVAQGAISSQPGTGLGLAITREMAQRMGGAAEGDSAPGRGNRFSFSVRLKKCPTDGKPESLLPMASAETQIRLGFPGARVLVAEDDSVNMMITQDMLQRAGLVADVAINGAEAVRAAQNRDYALILMDMHLPELDGLAATAQIRAQPRHLHTPILALTANAMPDDRLACLRAGMNDFMRKPVEPREFFATIHRWLARD